MWRNFRRVRCSYPTILSLCWCRERSLAIVAGSCPSFLWESCKFSLESAGTADAFFVALPMGGIRTDLVCHGTSISCTPYSQAHISGPSKLQIPVKHRTMSPYNWDLGISLPVKIQKGSDNYQNERIMLVFSNCAKSYASTIYKSQAGRQQPGYV